MDTLPVYPSDPGGYAPSLSRTGDLAVDVPAFLRAHGCVVTAAHCRAVAARAADLATVYGAAADAAATAGWLHDVSAVVPVAARVEAARAWDVDVLPEEVVAPMILHQKLSAVLAEALFGVEEAATLWAIRCHTTLRADASTLDKVVFLADKIDWDQAWVRRGTPPYLVEVEAGLRISLDAGVRAYLRYLWERRAALAVVHPWLRAAWAMLDR